MTVTRESLFGATSSELFLVSTTKSSHVVAAHNGRVFVARSGLHENGNWDRVEPAGM